jgi:hypothetical protein
MLNPTFSLPVRLVWKEPFHSYLQNRNNTAAFKFIGPDQALFPHVNDHLSCSLYNSTHSLTLHTSTVKMAILSWVESILRPTVSQPVRPGIRLPFEPMTRFYPYPFFSDNCLFFLPVGLPIWQEGGSVTYRAIADWSGHWGPITIHYCLIWDCLPFSLPLTTRRDCGGGILTCLHTEKGNTWSWS